MAAPSEGSSSLPTALSHDDVRQWWLTLDPSARAEFSHVHRGQEIHLRFACALDKLNLATLRPGPRGSEAQAYALAAGCDIEHAEKVFRGARSHPGVLLLLRAVEARDQGTGVKTFLDDPAPSGPVVRELRRAPSDRSAHLNGQPDRARAAREKSKRQRVKTKDDESGWLSLALSVDKSKWTDEQRYYARDLKTLCIEILGYKDIAPQPHDEVFEFIEPIIVHLSGGDGQEKCLLMIPRLLFKTSIGAVGLSIYLMILFPDIAILLDSHTWDISKAVLAEIKDHLEFNEKFRAVFGDWVTGSKKWDEESIRTNRCTVPRREGNIDTAGVDKDRTGGHYNVIICDDVCNRKNTETESGRRKVIRHISTLRPILRLDGVLFIIGTHWHHADAYRHIQREDAKREKLGKPAFYRKLIRGAYINGGELYAPTLLTHEKLDDLRASCTEEDFANWYLNKPIDEKSQIFPESLIRYYSGTFQITYSPFILLPDGATRIPVYVTIAWDPAGRKSSKRSAFHGFTVQGMGPDGHRFIMDAAEVKGAPAYVLEYVIGLITQYQPHAISVEDKGGYGLWIDMLRSELDRRGIACRIIEYAPTSWETKISRIKAQQVDFKARRVSIRTGLARLVEQLTEFPQLDFFDIIDTLPQHALIARAADPLEAAPFVQAEEDFDAPEDNRTGPRSGSWAGLGTPRPVKRSA